MACFDDLFELIGGFDRYQMWLMCYTAIVAMWSTDLTIHELVSVTMPHHCYVPVLSKLKLVPWRGGAGFTRYGGGAKYAYEAG